MFISGPDGWKDGRKERRKCLHGGAEVGSGGVGDGGGGETGESGGGCGGCSGLIQRTHDVLKAQTSLLLLGFRR